jgi:Rhodopirellula transposase DDE domain
VARTARWSASGIDLISATTTNTGLTVRCELDTNRYPKGITISDKEMTTINSSCAHFHGEWNFRPINQPYRVVNS